MKKTNKPQNNDINAQLLGLTDQHIHYFEPTHQQSNKPLVNSTKLGIHHLMLADYNALVASAAKANIDIKIASGFRTFERQLLIWNNKFTGKTSVKNITGEQVNISELSDFEIVEAIMLYSALPGASRHHWGCEIDVYAPNLLDNKKLQLEPWEYDESGPMAKLSTWLAKNAREFGFYFPYDSYNGGVAAEPWHLSYAPIAKLYQTAFNIEKLQQCLLAAEIKGKEAIVENLPTLFNRFINNVKSYDSVID